jgi:4-amino-4-deoxy-L-arabinose transferase-like glycosyltransferase
MSYFRQPKRGLGICMTRPESPSRVAGPITLIILAAALLFSICVRWRLREMPLERDEGGFAYMGQLLLQGIPPFQLAWDNKPPGLYVAYSAMMALFGQTTAGIRLGLLAVNLATIGLIFLFTRDLFDSLTGSLAAAAYSLLAVSPSVLGMVAHATHFAAFFGVAASWALWRALQSDKTPLLLASGLFFGAAFLMTQQSVFLPGFGALAVLTHYARLRPFVWRKLVARSAVVVLGMVLPFVATCLWLWRAGVFDRFWFWTVVYPQQHVQQVPLSSGARHFCSSFLAILGPNWPLAIAALFGVLHVCGAESARKVRGFLLAYGIFSFLSICPGLQFRPHYFIVLLPPAAIFSGVAGSELVEFTRRRMTRQRIDGGGPQPCSWPAIVLLVVAGALIVWPQREFFFRQTPAQVCRAIYGPEPFVESPAIAEYIRRHSAPDQTMAVLGSEPQLYFYARRNAATGYIFTYALMQRQPFAEKMRQEMCQEVETAKPAFLVLVDIPSSWSLTAEFDQFMLEWAHR